MFTEDPTRLRGELPRFQPCTREVARWLLGEIDERELLAAAAQLGNGIDPGGAECEARAFLGIRAELAGDRAAAIRHYEASWATGHTYYDEALVARLALRRLGAE